MIRYQVKTISNYCTTHFENNQVRSLGYGGTIEPNLIVIEDRLSMEDDLVWEHLHETVQTLYEEEENLLNAHMNAIQVSENLTCYKYN